MGQFRTYCLHFTNVSFLSEDEPEEDGSGSAGDSEDEPDPRVQEVCSRNDSISNSTKIGEFIK